MKTPNEKKDAVGRSDSNAGLERLALECNLWAIPGTLSPTASTPFNEKIIAFGRSVAEAEREACARVCDAVECPPGSPADDLSFEIGTLGCSIAIRMRSNV